MTKTSCTWVQVHWVQCRMWRFRNTYTRTPQCCSIFLLSDHHTERTSCACGNTICLRPLQVDSIFTFICQVAVLFWHNNIFIFIRQVAPIPAC